MVPKEKISWSTDETHVHLLREGPTPSNELMKKMANSSQLPPSNTERPEIIFSLSNSFNEVNNDELSDNNPISLRKIGLSIMSSMKPRLLRSLMVLYVKGYTIISLHRQFPDTGVLSECSCSLQQQCWCWVRWPQVVFRLHLGACNSSITFSLFLFF